MLTYSYILSYSESLVKFSPHSTFYAMRFDINPVIMPIIMNGAKGSMLWSVNL